MAGAEDVFDSHRGRSGESDSGEDVDEESESKAAIKDNVDGGGGTTTEYEKQRLRRIRQNRERTKALGLIGVAKSPRAKVAEEDDDDEYMPCDEDQSGPSESDYDVTKAATNSRSRSQSQSLSRSRSLSRKMKRKISTPRKKASEHTIDCSESVDEEKALMQAIALSLEDSHAVPLVPYAGTSRKLNLNVNEINDDTGKRKKTTKVPNRVQMTENDVVIHFCQFDVVGKGSITKRDLQRMAACHDFLWTDKEFDDMIRCFDCNGDGKLSLDEFRNIVSRCGMPQGFSTLALGGFKASES